MENNFQYISASITDKGLSEKRPQNEDSFLELNASGLFAVADGVGGAQAGDVASQMAMEILAEAFVNMKAGGDAEEVMKAGIEAANSAIFQMSHDLPQLSTMATTIVALHLSGNIATIGHVGDSRLYRIDANGSLYRETQDHSVVEEEVRAGRMSAAQAATHPSRNVISRALGAEPLVEIDMKTIMFEPNTSFLICSDGITRHLEDFELRDLLSSNASPNVICNELKRICYQRGAEDNLTAVIIRVSSEIAKNERSTEVEESVEIEEPTVATTRKPLVNTSVLTPNYQTFDEIPTQDLRMPENLRTNEPENLNDFEIVSDDSDSESESFTETNYTEKSDSVKNQINENVIPFNKDSADSALFNDQQTESSGGMFSKLLSGLLLLIIGAAIGATAFYFYSKSNIAQEIPKMPEPQSQNPALKSFEDLRRNVDENPQKFLIAGGNAPQSAEDFYLVGRANLLIGKYAESKVAFTEAKNRLAQAETTNAKILATDISMALAIINNPLAQEVFTKDVSTLNPNNQSNSNTNANK